MGLDIFSYRVCKFIQPLTEECRQDECRHCDDDFLRHYSPNDPVFSHNSIGFNEGVYRVSNTENDGPDCFHFRAGSYHGYNLWREWLCQFATGEEYQEFWFSSNLNALMTGKRPPFWELLNMSDCEGVITGQAIRNLLKDFEDNRERALAWRGTKVVPKRWRSGVPEEEDAFDKEYWIKKYEDWTQAFRVAAPEGIVVFC